MSQESNKPATAATDVSPTPAVSLKPLDCGLQIFETREEIRYFQVAAARQALKLESLGMRHSRIRGGLRKLWAKHYNLPNRATFQEVYERMTQELKQIKEQVNGQRNLPL